MASWQAAVVTWKKKADPWQLVKATVRPPMKSHVLPPEPAHTEADLDAMHWQKVDAVDHGKCPIVNCERCARRKDKPDVR